MEDAGNDSGHVRDEQKQTRENRPFLDVPAAGTPPFASLLITKDARKAFNQRGDRPPEIKRLPPPASLARVKAFLPVMKQEEEKMSAKLKDETARKLVQVGDCKAVGRQLLQIVKVAQT